MPVICGSLGQCALGLHWGHLVAPCMQGPACCNPQPEQPQTPHPWLLPLLQVTVGLCQIAAPTRPIFISLDEVYDDNPSGLDITDLYFSTVDIANNALPACGTSSGAFQSFGFPVDPIPGQQSQYYPLVAGRKYALVFRPRLIPTPEFAWVEQPVTPTPSSYFVAFKLSTDGGATWLESTQSNAVRIGFTCGASLLGLPARRRE